MSLMGSPQWMYSSGDFTIDQSLRLNNDDTATLTRTPTSAGNRRTFTTSIWFKLSQVTSSVRLFTAQASAGGTPFYTIDVFQDGATDNRGIRVNSSANSDELMLITNGRLRDVSAWYHLVVAVDTTQGTAANRCKIYLNGAQLANFATETYPSQNYDTPCNNTIKHNIGAQGNGNNPFDGYMAEFHHIDGTALTPASFGETDDDYGHWKPIRYAGTYGTNGCYLSFAGGGIIAATGGTITTDGDYKVHSFTSSGTFTVTSVGSDNYVSYLVVAGGGGAGGASGKYGSGGGAGGMRTGVLTVAAQAYSITVGSGGASQAKGSNSIFSTITSTGGGRGPTSWAHGTDYSTDLDGGSGGGTGTYENQAGGSGIAGQGNDGGTGSTGAGAGGGGGAGAVGGAAGATSGTGGAGGAGLVSYITGSSVTYAGGGGGSGWDAIGSHNGGAGGGGRSYGHNQSQGSDSNGTANTGGGGGGGSNKAGGTGGSGIVIIRYKFQ